MGWKRRLKRANGIRDTTQYASTLEHCNFNLNIFQDYVFTYFKEESQCNRNDV